ncbi:MAG: tetratricopeptide repeat protein, partial [bacterium]
SNPFLPPSTLEGEAMGGAEGLFFPSAAETAHKGLIPAKFFLDSQNCGRSGCHPDIYHQWQASAHRFSSFNNQWYRKAIEYMQSVIGLQAPQWCAGCHDPALLFTGQMKQPVKKFINTPEAQAGLGCIMCHSIVRVKNSMGNGGYILEYPKLHDLAISENRLVRTLHDFFVKIDPGPHRKSFMKPFHRKQTAEFCSLCHKVHLDKPVNNYRWIRGFNEYDNWQASGVSGYGARSFYYPPIPQKCTDCHMPLVSSKDAGNIHGFVHSHRFVGANTALPIANKDPVQLKLTEDFLKNDQVSVDIFAVSIPSSGGQLTGGPSHRIRDAAPQIASTFAVGEEQAMAVGDVSIQKQVVAVIAPLEDDRAALRPGDSVRLDVVVRTLGVGHFFPGGTVDAQEVWLEVKVVDNTGRVIFWSGSIANEGKGRVDPTAHFYRNILLDAHGNPINKRNAWAARSVLYVNLIPPGAADVAHYRLNIPQDCGNEIIITAKLHYRKFNWWNTHWAYAGVRDPDQPGFELSPHYDDSRWVFTGDTRHVSGKLKQIPILPIVTMAKDSVRLRVTSKTQITGNCGIVASAKNRDRWNDYGIGLLLQGDLKGAQQAFHHVTGLDPAYLDGWVNLARVYLREGNLQWAEAALASAEKVQPGFHKTYYFRGLLHKVRGEYQQAVQDLQAVANQYPKDRVVLNQIGRVYYLNAEPEKAIPYFQRVLDIDVEDLMAHYNLMLCYRALGDTEKSKAHEILYLRYKEDESAKSIAQEYRRLNPYDNNESQPIHEHDSGASIQYSNSEY